MEDFSITHDGLRLDGTIFEPAEKAVSHPTILFIPGWTAERSRSVQYATSLVKLGYLCVTADLRGHGTSEGDRNGSTNEEFLSDVLAFYDYVVAMENVDTKRMSAVGSSFGGYLVALLTGERPLKNVVLRAPADYLNSAFTILKRLANGDDAEVMKWRHEKRTPGETYATKALQGFTGNVLILESGNDERIPHQTILNYIDAVADRSKLTHVVMPEAPHSIREGPWRDKVDQILVDWFKDRQ